ncbi:MAG: DUF3488 domain-containing protein [Synechococcales cyanobacterium M58_A2018_015]|nr:DUF3488 domain-containing protein [Synechococcales cyanobacterium M58_A2018_015]
MSTRPVGKPVSRSRVALLHLPFGQRLWHRFQQQPPVEPENSVLLRVLVQALVAVGIIATDLAAADSADALGISAWAVPASGVGAVWSWLQRYKRNIPVKFCIAIAMLLALAAFFTRLWGERNDTRLALATLLIHLQVFHSFDLPRRKDLGYSVVIALILLGVAATLSQTLTLAPLILVFLGLAVPVLMLDYRSRLGLAPSSWQRTRSPISWQPLGRFLLLIGGLGLVIFLALPRFPGYQLRSFPVSTPIPMQEEFNPSTILNSGYVRQGTPGSGGGGLNQEQGPGELNPEVYYGFNSRINQNLRGILKPRVVMRVRSQAPGYWRVLAFDRYTGQGWEISRNAEEQLQTLERPVWSFRFTLPWSVTLNRTREVIQSYTIVSDLPNLIPALYEAKELYFPTDQIALDAEGSLRSPVPLSEGLTYSVVSEVPYRNRTQLQQATSRAPAAIRDYYLQLPPEVAARVQEKTKAILAGSPKPLTTPYEQVLYLAQYLKQNYTIQPDLPFFADNEDLVEAFLFKYEGGYPDHFTTVLTVMLRSIGIPARLVMGFGSGEFNPLTGFYVVQNIDAHAVTEVYFHKYGWFAFDPIPGHELLPVSIEETETFGVLRQAWNWVAGWLPSPLTGFLTRLFQQLVTLIGGVLSGLVALFSRGWLGILAGCGLLTSVGFLGWLSWRGWRHWCYRRWLAKLPPMEALYQQMLRHLALHGFPKSPAQTPLEYAADCRVQQPIERAKAIDEISRAYVDWRYGGQPADLTALQRHLKHLKTQLQKPLRHVIWSRPHSNRR